MEKLMCFQLSSETSMNVKRQSQKTAVDGRRYKGESCHNSEETG